MSSLGKTRHLLVSGLIGSWVGQVPVCFLFSIFWRNDIIGKSFQNTRISLDILNIGLFWGMSVGYGLHALCLCLCLTNFINWEQCAEEAKERNKRESTEKDEESFSNI